MCKKGQCLGSQRFNIQILLGAALVAASSYRGSVIYRCSSSVSEASPEIQLNTQTQGINGTQADISYTLSTVAGICWQDGTHAPESSGGWLQESSLLQKYKAACDLDSIHYNELSPDTFRSRHMGKRPVVLKGWINDLWLAVKAQRWSRSKFQQRFGDSVIQVESGSALIASQAFTTSVKSIKEMLQSMRQAASQHRAGLEPHFSLDMSFLGAGDDGSDDYDIPPHFSSFHNASGVPDGQCWTILSLGGAGSGTPFHSHGHTWLGLVYGYKLWAIYPPGYSAPPETERAAHYHLLAGSWAWVRDVLPHLAGDDRPLLYMQRPGDILYLPPGWKHLTMNLGEAVGVGGQAHYPDQDLMMESLKILRDSPGDFDAHRGVGLGIMATVAERYRQEQVADPAHPAHTEAVDLLNVAIHHYRLAMDIDPTHPGVYLLLAWAQTHSGDLRAALATLDKRRHRFDRANVPETVSNHTLAVIHLYAADFYVEQHMYSAAEELVRSTVLALEPDSVDALIILGSILQFQGKFQEAHQAFLQAYHYAPYSSEVQQHLRALEVEHT